MWHDEEMEIAKSQSQRRMWRIFLPRIFGGQCAGGLLELLTIVAINAYRVWLSIRTTALVRSGDTVLFTRNATQYWANQRSMVQLLLESTALTAISKYVFSRLRLMWKKRLTEILYEKYFARANYYFIEKRNIEMDEDNKIADADVRQCSICRPGHTSTHVCGSPVCLCPFVSTLPSVTQPLVILVCHGRMTDEVEQVHTNPTAPRCDTYTDTHSRPPPPLR